MLTSTAPTTLSAPPLQAQKHDRHVFLAQILGHKLLGPNASLSVGAELQGFLCRRVRRSDKTGPGEEKEKMGYLFCAKCAQRRPVVSKYADHLPLYRQSARLERETGLELSRATLDGLVMRVGELLRPITLAMRQELLSGDYIQADETPVGVQSERAQGKKHQAYLWQYSRPGGAVVFDFRLGREREGPKRFLGNFAGILQSDGYAAYDHVGGPKMVHAACWAHARRKFFQAVELNPEDQTALGIVVQMDRLSEIETQARQEALSPEDRHSLRLEKSKPLLDSIKSRIEAARSDALPRACWPKPANYTLTLWTRLRRLLQYPVLELSNNLAENAMRPVALGRRNWIHIGSEDAGPRVAAIVSIAETCRRLKIPVRDYLGSVLPGLSDFPINRIAELTPSAWAASAATQNTAAT